MPDFSHALRNRQPLVVGAIADRKQLELIVNPDECDLIELRLDCLGPGPGVRAFAEKHEGPIPLLFTARHPAEGGVGNLDEAARARLLEDLFDLAAVIDLELRSLPAMASTWDLARDQGLLRVASAHDFEACPTLAKLIETVRNMAEHGADVAKIAVRVHTPADLLTLANLLSHDSPLPLAVMGMGPLAPSSRLLAAQLGSVLNYGFLGNEATAPGQWPAKLLREAISRSEKAW